MAVLLAAVVVPFVLVVIVICSLVSATADHNNAAIRLTFFGGNIPITMPGEYRTYILEMRECFVALDRAIADVEALFDEENPPEQGLDDIRIKAVFYAVYFGTEDLRLKAAAAREFVDCFVTYEERTVPQTDENGDPLLDENGEEIPSEETVTVAIPITDLQQIYANVAAYIGRPLTREDMVNITEIYVRIKFGAIDSSINAGDSLGNGTHDLIDNLIGDSDVKAEGGYTSPLSGNWRSLISSGFGNRPNPTGSGTEFHTGVDVAVGLGTPVLSVKAGKVLFVRHASSGYGLHVAIDHGGGVVSMYAHCSEILVSEGQTVTAGQTIAKVGSTGRSTGPHLHFEIVVGGKPVNPLDYI